MPWTTILIWTITIFTDGPCSCLWCFCWASFLIKRYGRDLVMDDYHGQTKLNLNPYQFPHCPCVLHITVTLTCGDFFIGRRIFQVACQGDLGSNVLDVDTWRNPSNLQIALFRSSKNCHVAYFGWLASFQCPTLLPINRGIPFLPSHISHIFFSNISRPSLLV